MQKVTLREGNSIFVVFWCVCVCVCVFVLFSKGSRGRVRGC